jgi:hypothetical protein
VHQVGFFTRIYRDVRSAKHKIFQNILCSVTWLWPCLCRNALQFFVPQLTVFIFRSTVTPTSVTKDWLHRARFLYVCRIPDVTCTGQGAADVCSLVGMRRRYSETPATSCHDVRRHIPHDSTSHSHCCDSLKSRADCWYSGQCLYREGHTVSGSSVSVMTKGRVGQPKDLGSIRGRSNACFLSHSVQTVPVDSDVCLPAAEVWLTTHNLQPRQRQWCQSGSDALN